MTLVEMLVSVALTLMIVFAIVQIFDLLGHNVTTSRAMIEMSGQLRAVANRLQADLDGITVPMRPPADHRAAVGYAEFGEGRASDRDSNLDGYADANQLAVDTALGDTDDVLMFTTQSAGEPFVGRLVAIPGRPTPQIESQLAEVVWWVQFARTGFATPALGVAGDDTTPQYPNGTRIRSLHRRALLIRPDLDLSPLQNGGGYPVKDPDDIAAFFNNNDISAHLEQRNGGSVLVANSLADLTKRENRFARRTPSPQAFIKDGRFYPSPIDQNVILERGTLKDLVVGGAEHLRRGEDVMLSDVLAFDLRVYDPNAPITELDNIAIVPGDPVYDVHNRPAGRGAFVDLDYANLKSFVTALPLSGLPHSKSGLNSLTYCTWSTHYESDGLDQDDDGEKSSPRDPITGLRLADGKDNDGNGRLDEGIDEGVDGVDYDGKLGPDGVVDDAGEQETSPPYPVPLRGISVTLRMMEFNTRQVRQISVVGEFLPE